jgi:hypothetical protein
MSILVSTPNSKFGQDMKKSAPAGIRVLIGYPSAYSPNANVPGIAMVGFDKVKPCDVDREHFVTWLLNETTKDEQCTLSYDGVRIEKYASVFGQVFDDMEKHKNGKPSPEDEA